MDILTFTSCPYKTIATIYLWCGYYHFHVLIVQNSCNYSPLVWKFSFSRAVPTKLVQLFTSSVEFSLSRAVRTKLVQLFTSSMEILTFTCCPHKTRGTIPTP